MGWNACSSCHEDSTKSRSKLVIPALATSTVYIIDTSSKPRAPALFKTILGEEIKSKTGLGNPHTSHCLGSGEIMISMMGDKAGESRGNFVLLNEAFDVKGVWCEDHSTPFGYDFWYQPRHNIMVSTEYGRPNSFLKVIKKSTKICQNFLNFVISVLIQKMLLNIMALLFISGIGLIVSS